jgi:hypothetical protein
MARLVTLAQAKLHLRVDGDDQNADIDLKLVQASDMVLRYLKGRRLSLSSITSSGGVATLTTATAHGLTTNDTVTIWGATQPEYNGSVVVTVVDPTSLTFAITGTPVSPATGGIGVSVAETWTTATVPSPVQAAVLILLAHLHEQRGDDLSGGEAVWTGIERLLVSYRTPALA